ncbi:hypothetical protein [Thalassovita sp.]|uniref:hypothetical protein n=1 Tax=Thalassovita sp. TaxID=1979401 RepID=UPI0029DE67FE|nr:hypothetical protein [Thalassovita sp.]
MSALRGCLIWAALALAAGTSSPVRAEQLTAAQMRAAAVVALDSGRPQVALALSRALLTRDPDDLMALLAQARAARDMGRFALAETAARRAWALSDTDGERYDSARMLAQVLSSQGQRTRAQLWLRRAVQNAPDPATRAQAVRDFTYVRARNPLKLNLSFAASPESNINNGSIRDETQVFDFFSQQYIVADLSGGALALSGLEARAGLDLRYTLSESPRHRTDLVLQAGMRRYHLSDSAKAAAPAVSASDFAYDNLDIGLQHRWRQDGWGEMQMGLLAGGARYGGQAYSQRLRLDTGLSRPLGPQARMTLSFGAEATRGPRAPHADLLRMGLDLTRRTGNGGQLTGFVTLTTSQSAAEAADFTEAQLGLETRPAWKMFGSAPTLGLALRWRDYDSYVLFSPDGRQDREASAYIKVRFAGAEYMGFTPSLTISASRTDSSIGLFDVDRTGVALGIESAF